MRAIILSIATCLCLATQAVAAPQDGTDLKLRVMETTDLHMWLANYNYFTGKKSESIGLANTAALIKAARQEVKNSILVDNGDLIQGSPLGDFMYREKYQDIVDHKDVHPVYKAMNLLNYDVANIGNHEFNYGLEFLQASLKGANFPYISANLYIDDGDQDDSNNKPYFTPYLIQEKTYQDNQGKDQILKIGFIGFVPPQVMQWDKKNLEGKVIAADIVEAAKKYIPEMKAKGADIIIAIPHSGLSGGAHEKMMENAAYHLAKVKDINAILFGHNHQVFPGSKNFNDIEGVNNSADKASIHGVPAVMPGFWGNHLGIIDLSLTYQKGAWQVTDFKTDMRAISRREKDRSITSLVEAEAEILKAIDSEHQGTIAWVNKPFAKAAANINSYFALVADDPSIQIVADAQIEYGMRQIQGTELDGLPVLSAAAPFRAGRQGPDDFTNVAAGPIALRNTVDLYIYPNTVKILKLTGGQIQEWLEMSAGQFNRIDVTQKAPQALINIKFPSYNFDVIDGVSYQIDVTQPARYDQKGKLVQPDARRIVNLEFNGKPIDLKQDFLVVSNNYRASGGGKFPDISADKIVVDAPDENRQVLANYIIAKSKAAQGDKGVDPTADQNWRFAPIQADVMVTFRSSPSDQAKIIAARMPQLKVTDQIDADGFAIYQLSFK